MEEEVDMVYLTWQELSLVYHPTLSSNTNLEKYRHLYSYQFQKLYVFNINVSRPCKTAEQAYITYPA